MRIVVDLDGTICELRRDDQSYSEVKVLPKAVETLKKLKDAGHYIIIYSARHMKTCNGDVNEVKKKVGDITIEWLERHGVLYDELHFGKPYGHVYIDDLALTFEGWDKIDPKQFSVDKR